MPGWLPFRIIPICCSKERRKISLVKYKVLHRRKKRVNINQNRVYLRVDMILPTEPIRLPFYSLDSTNWKSIGLLAMSYDLSVLWATGLLFNYAAKSAGRYADFDWFEVGSSYNQKIVSTVVSVEKVNYRQ